MNGQSGRGAPTDADVDLHESESVAGATGRRAQIQTILRRASTEIVLLGILYYLYKWVRFVARSDTAEAVHNARRVIDFERAVGWFTEETLQDFVIGHEWMIKFLNSYYMFVHFPATITFLVVMFFFRQSHYPRVRQILILMSAAAVGLHLAMPLAPPRMMPFFGFVDTGRLFGPSPYSTNTAAGIANQFAAMPSLHFGWAVLVAWSSVKFFRHRWRWMVVAHPSITLVAIVLTANHYWLDAVVAGLIFVIFAVLSRPRSKQRALPEVTSNGVAVHSEDDEACRSDLESDADLASAVCRSGSSPGHRNDTPGGSSSDSTARR